MLILAKAIRKGIPVTHVNFQLKFSLLNITYQIQLDKDYSAVLAKLSTLLFPKVSMKYI